MSRQRRVLAVSKERLGEAPEAVVDVALMWERDCRGLVIGSLAQSDANPVAVERRDVVRAAPEVGLNDDAHARVPGVGLADEFERALGVCVVLHVDADERVELRRASDDAEQVLAAGVPVDVEAELRQLDAHVPVEPTTG